MAKSVVFEKQSLIPASLEAVWNFHASPGAFHRLTPPLMISQVHRDQRKSLTEGELEFTLWFGPLPVRWLAVHEPGPTPMSFRDRMIRGPLATWVHDHSMVETMDGVLLTDHITYSHMAGVRGWISRLLFSRAGLALLFGYRHWITRKIVVQDSANSKGKRASKAKLEVKGYGREK